MTWSSPTSLTEDRRLAEAAAWRARVAEQRLESCPPLEQWLAADPLNAQAYGQAEAVWDEIGDIATTPEFMDVRRRALEIASQQSRRNRGGRGGARAMAAALMTVMVMIGGGGAYWSLTKPQVYETKFGERRVVPLADGSRISLDSDSRVEVRYSADARKLTLLRGQARFDVAHNVQRPFSVQARDETVVATGTAFNIDLAESRTLVTLIEGHVVILRADRPGAARRHSAKPQSVTLKAGEELVAAPLAAPVVRMASLEKTTAWESGRLVFDNEPLGVVAAQISRYASQAVIADPSVTALKVSGVFNAGDSDSFVEAMTSYLPVRAVTRPDGATVLVRR